MSYLIESSGSTHFKKRITNSTHEDKSWRIYNSPIKAYEHTFHEVLGDRRIVDLLEDVKNPVVIDLMAPAGTLFDLFYTNNLEGSGISVSLEDYRSGDQSAVHRDFGIEQVTGDIMKSSTWKKIQHSLAGKRADLILERAVAGVENLPYDKRLYKVLIDKAWDLLKSDGGILLFEGMQFNRYEHTIGDVDIRGWVDAVSASGVEVAYSLSNSPWWPCSTFMFVRNSDSPVKLPTM